MKRAPNPRALAVASHKARLRQAGGKRTSVDLTAGAIADMQVLQNALPGVSTSEIICRALTLARAHVEGVAE